MSWTLLAGSLAAVVALAAIARRLRLGESNIADPETAMALAEAHLVGFHARHALVGGNGEGALVAGNGTLALLKRHGARVAVRRMVAPLTLSPAVEGVAIDSGEAMFGRVALFGVTDDQVREVEALANRPTVH
ncbi:hypothetical protein [Sphingomonas sp. Y38-1Y]|uniref:hypothetical protein n=1 Tax=Sphingomonas sp. Y38-1Y TaxID=3078265 RepID=UPI0028EAE62E|nr:hypothetical protein [Sphingomonas sp. Y38-1Y]